MRAVLALVLLVAGCAGPAAQPPYPGPDYWTDYVADMQASGMMRTERSPAGIEYTNGELAEAFRQIMFYDEIVLDGDRFVRRRTPRPLEKRTGATSYAIVGLEASGTDQEHAADIAARLAEATGLEIPEGGINSEILVYISGPDERRALAERFEAQWSQNPFSDGLRGDLNGSICTATSIGTNDAGDAVYIVMIPSEVTGLLRRSCIEEEIAQAFGPAADWTGARPSIFNDDEEFALMTAHDAWLLRLLYHPDIRNGVSESEGMPVVRRLLRQLRPEGERKIVRPGDRKRETDDAFD